MKKRSKNTGQTFNLTGHIEAETRNAVTGDLVQRVEADNLVLNTCLNHLGTLLTTGGAPFTIGGGVIGIGNVAPTGTDTGITGPQLKAALTAAGMASATGSLGTRVLQYSWAYATNEATTTAGGANVFTEVGLCVNSAGTFPNANTLYTRATHGEITKSTDVTLSYTYTLNLAAVV